jgi:hypothetical protein
VIKKGVKSPETPAQTFASDEAGSRKLAFFTALLRGQNVQKGDHDEKCQA